MVIEPLTLDARPFHERHEEPFDAIMAAVDSLEPRQSFLLINSFEPVPLIKLLRRRGFEVSAAEVAPGEWRVLFTPQ